MMFAGVSTACLYPEQPERALARLGELGVRNVELFINSSTELTEPVFSEIRRIIADYKLNVVSLHPFSMLEAHFLFSSYERRVEEGFEQYKRYFECAGILGAKYFVLHGDTNRHVHAANICPDNLYIERYLRLYELARAQNVTLAQENVCYCRSGDLQFLLMMKRNIPEQAVFVLDQKQARRSGTNPVDFVRALGGRIVHVHASDADSKATCLNIGDGDTDFRAFFSELRRVGYGGGVMLELYRDNYKEPAELAVGMRKIEQFLSEME